MRLIDGDSLMKTVFNDVVLVDGEVKGVGLILAETVDKAPTIDTVPVVRCRECEHHYWEQEPCHGKTVHYCELPHMRGVEVFKEFFCNYGERGEREEGDE